jgi:hypothetical protein
MVSPLFWLLWTDSQNVAILSLSLVSLPLSRSLRHYSSKSSGTIFFRGTSSPTVVPNSQFTQYGKPSWGSWGVTVRLSSRYRPQSNRFAYFFQPTLWMFKWCIQYRQEQYNHLFVSSLIRLCFSVVTQIKLYDQFMHRSIFPKGFTYFLSPLYVYNHQQHFAI